jgi:hypothetical protein
MPRHRGAVVALFLALVPDSASKTQAPANDALPIIRILKAQNYVAGRIWHRARARKLPDDAETSEGARGIPKNWPVVGNGRLRTHRTIAVRRDR